MFFLTIYLAAIGFAAVSGAEVDQEALRECGDLFDIDIHDTENSTGRFANEKCRILCQLDGEPYPARSINQGYPCPGDPSGICHAGECVGTQREALEECASLHNLKPEDHWNQTGSRFTPDHCALECYIEGKHESHPMNQGQVCRTGDGGVCLHGICSRTSMTVVSQTTNTLPATTGRPVTATPIESTTVADPVHYYKDLHHVESLNVTITHADLNSAYAGTHAMICLVPSSTSTVSDCRQRCETSVIAELTQHPVWNHVCTFNALAFNDLRIFTSVWRDGESLFTDSDGLNYLLISATFDSSRKVAEWHLFGDKNNNFLYYSISFIFPR